MLNLMHSIFFCAGSRQTLCSIKRSLMTISQKSRFLFVSIAGLLITSSGATTQRNFTRTAVRCYVPNQVSPKGNCMKSLVDGQYYIYTEDAESRDRAGSAADLSGGSDVSYSSNHSRSTRGCPDGKCGMRIATSGRTNPYSWVKSRNSCPNGNCGTSQTQVSSKLCPNGNCGTIQTHEPNKVCPTGNCGYRGYSQTQATPACPSGNCGYSGYSQTPATPACPSGKCGNNVYSQTPATQACPTGKCGYSQGQSGGYCPTGNCGNAKPSCATGNCNQGQRSGGAQLYSNVSPNEGYW